MFKPHGRAHACQARVAAVAELVQDYEQRLVEERAASAALAQRLKEALDRSAKMRTHTERERRALQVGAANQPAVDCGSRWAPVH